MVGKLKDKLAFLNRVPLFENLLPSEREALAASLRSRRYSRGTMIFHQDDPGHSLYIIASGQVRIFRISAEGYEMSVAIFGEGDVFGELAIIDGQPRSASAVAMTDVETLILHREDFVHHLHSSPRMAIGVLEVLSQRLRTTTDYAESLVALDVYGRVVRELVTLADQHGQVTKEGVLIDIPLTQTELASLVGTSRESVNKVLGRLRDAGLVRLQRNRILLLNIDEMRNWTH